MKNLAIAFNWLLCLVFVIFALSTLANEDWIRAGLVFVIAILLFPPVKRRIDEQGRKPVTGRGGWS